MKVFFHLGYPRTATTFIQKNLFEKHSEINYLGPKYYNLNTKPFFNSDNINFIKNLNSTSDLNACNSKKIFKNIILDEKKTNLISSERFLTYGTNFFPNLIKLKKLLKFYSGKIEFYIFFMIRNQYDAIFSYYHHAYSEIIKKVKIKDFDEIIINKNEFKNNEIKYFFENYNYFNYYKILKNNFKKKNIKIFLYEEFINNKKNFDKEIAKFLSINLEEASACLSGKRINNLKIRNNIINVEKIYFPRLYEIYKKLNIKNITPIFVRNILKFFFIEKKKNIILPNQKKEIKKKFYLSNKRLESEYRIKLPEDYY